jgi:hypothetical protein
MTPPSDLFPVPNGGIAEIANYKEQVLTEYRDNPLIEALPPILTHDEFVTAVTEYPAFDNSEKKLDASLRLHCVERVLNYFQPLSKHIELEQKISRIIRQGYLERNPLGPMYAARSRQIDKSLRKGGGCKIALLKKYVSIPTSASGFTMIGVSGVGKTTAIKRVLGLYPQIILHSEYKGTPLNLYQIVWLKLNCPHAGSLKGLCTDFFIEIDKLLGTDYHKKHGSKNNSEDTMLAQMGIIADTHCLGVLGVDEIQDLSTAKSGGSEKVLNFFVKLVHTIGVPVVRIATNKALPILQGDFRHARRGVGEGGTYWDRLIRTSNEERRIWRFFVEGFFEYQWTKKTAAYTDEIDKVLYEESQGIIDIAVKLFMIAQWRAIALGTEIITAETIEKVADDSLQLVRPMLNALKSGDEELISKYSDIKPIDIEGFYKSYLAELEKKHQRKLEQLRELPTSSSDVPSLLNGLILNLLDLGLSPRLAKLHAEKAVSSRKADASLADLVKEAYRAALTEESAITEPASPERKKQPAKNLKGKSYLPDDLRLIVAEAKRTRQSAYDGLKDAGVIKPSLEDFLNTREA